jgi:hypothetical protein
MGEYIPATVQFGGKVKRSLIPTLIELLERYDMRAEGDEEAEPTPENITEKFRGDQINYGQIEDITTFCQSHNIDYEHWADGANGGDPYIVRWIDGKEEMLGYSDGEIMIPLARVLEIETLITGMADLIALARRWAKPLEMEIVDG